MFWEWCVQDEFCGRWRGKPGEKRSEKMIHMKKMGFLMRTRIKIILLIIPIYTHSILASHSHPHSLAFRSAPDFCPQCLLIVIACKLQTEGETRMFNMPLNEIYHINCMNSEHVHLCRILNGRPCRPYIATIGSFRTFSDYHQLCFDVLVLAQFNRIARERNKEKERVLGREREGRSEFVRWSQE